MGIEADKLTVSRGGRRILDGVTFHAREGRLTAVLGRNGAGKSTLFRALLGLIRADSGAARIDGADVRALPPRKLAAMCAYVPQSRPDGLAFTVLEMVLMGASAADGVFTVPGRRQTDAARAALARLGLDGLRDRTFARLSGGEQQLVLTARALAQGGRNLIMDEPASALDIGHRTLILDTARALADEGYAVLMSTHDPQQALRYADDVLALDGGRADFGETRAMLTGPRLSALCGTEIALIETALGPVILPARGTVRR